MDTIRLLPLPATVITSPTWKKGEVCVGAGHGLARYVYGSRQHLGLDGSGG